MAERKTSMRTPIVKADLSVRMEMIIQLAKRLLIQICHALKQNKEWEISGSPCPTKLMTPISNRLWFRNLKFI